MQEGEGIKLSEGLTLKTASTTGNLCFLLLKRIVISIITSAAPRLPLPLRSAAGKELFALSLADMHA